MLTVDDVVKLLLAGSVAFSIIVISFQLMRLIGALADNLKDLRRAVQNIGKASDMMLEDYSKIRRIIDSVERVVTNFRESVIEPLGILKSIARKFAGDKKTNP